VKTGGFWIGKAQSVKAVPVTMQVMMLSAMVIFDRRLKIAFLPISLSFVIN
jgi:hypothetical protein